MIKVFLDAQYPKNLAGALELLHQMQYTQQFEIIHSGNLTGADKDSVVFLFDRTKKGVDLITEKHFEEGYKVFAFKCRQVSKLDIFQLSLSVLSFWPKIIQTINSEPDPFIITYKYVGSTLNKVR